MSEAMTDKALRTEDSYPPSLTITNDAYFATPYLVPPIMDSMQPSWSGEGLVESPSGAVLGPLSWAYMNLNRLPLLLLNSVPPPMKLYPIAYAVMPLPTVPKCAYEFKPIGPWAKDPGAREYSAKLLLTGESTTIDVSSLSW